jgi:hypothetical protein
VHLVKQHDHDHNVKDIYYNHPDDKNKDVYFINEQHQLAHDRPEEPLHNAKVQKHAQQAVNQDFHHDKHCHHHVCHDDNGAYMQQFP